MRRITAAWVMILILLPCGFTLARESGQAYFDLGVFAYEDKDYQGAEANFRKALSLNPDNPGYAYYLGKTLMEMERYEEARSAFERARRLRSDLPGLAFDTALLYYRMTRYEEAARLFAAAAAESPGDPRPRFYRGLSLFKGGEYKDALPHFETAGELSRPLADDAAFYAGVCRLKTGDVDGAMERFRYVRDQTDSERLRGHAEKWLRAVADRRKAEKPYAIYLKAGYQYDDNVLLTAPDDPTPTDEDDFLWKGFFWLRGDLFRRDRFRMGLGYSQYNTFHRDLTENDMVGATGTLYMKYKRKTLTFGLDYAPSYYRLDGRDFLMRHLIRPEVAWRMGDRTTLRLAYGLYFNDYEIDASDGRAHEVLIDLYRTLGERTYLFGGLGWEDNDADADVKSYGKYLAKAGVSVGLPWESAFGLTGRYHFQDYDAGDREDQKYSISASLEKDLLQEWLTLTVDYDYTRNDSDVNEYEKNTVELSVKSRF